MPKENTTIENEIKLTKEVKSLTTQIRRLKNLEFVQVLKKPRRLFIFSLLHGILVGFGSVIGATLGVGIFIYFLTQVSLVPIIGEYVEKIIKEINIEQVEFLRPVEQEFIEEKEILEEVKGTHVTPLSITVPEEE